MLGRAVEDRAALGLDQDAAPRPRRSAPAARCSPAWVMTAKSAFSQPRPQKSETASQSRSPGAEMKSLADVPHVLDERKVLELHALRQRRGAGGVEQVGPTSSARTASWDRSIAASSTVSARSYKLSKRRAGWSGGPPRTHDLPHAGQRIALAAERVEGLQVVVLEEAVDGDQETWCPSA